jgi:hypothetical protein
MPSGVMKCTKRNELSHLATIAAGRGSLASSVMVRATNLYHRLVEARSKHDRRRSWRGKYLDKGTCCDGRRFQRMPYFYFDLVVDKEFSGQGSMILEDLAAASDRADQLASELYIVKPALRSRGCAIRVTDGDGNEVYQTPIDPLPTIGRR